MTKVSMYNIRVTACNLLGDFRLLSALLFCFLLMPAGCVTVDPGQQRLVGKPNMQFSGSTVFSYHDRLLTQIESGSASSTGGQSGSCGSCVAGGAQ